MHHAGFTYFANYMMHYLLLIILCIDFYRQQIQRDDALCAASLGCQTQPQSWLCVEDYLLHSCLWHDQIRQSQTAEDDQYHCQIGGQFGDYTGNASSGC